MSLCKSCLNEVSTITGQETTYDNALIIEFHGGYGMFFDDIDDPDHIEHTVILCHDCAHDLCDKIPFIKNMLNPRTSHSHTLEFIKANPDHKGYDIDGAFVEG